MNTNNNIEKLFVEGWKLEQHEAHHSNDKHKQQWTLTINKNNTSSNTTHEQHPTHDDAKMTSNMKTFHKDDEG
jgi:hypothetical protein